MSYVPLKYDMTLLSMIISIII